MKSFFPFTAGIALYFIFGIYWAVSDFPRFGAKALFGAVIGTLVFGGYTVVEFRRMMRGEDPRYDEERKWVENRIQLGLPIANAKESLRERFALKQEAAGFSPLHGATTVLDFSSQLSDLRIVAKNDSIVSLKIEVCREERA